jgi:uncharacterized protein
MKINSGFTVDAPPDQVCAYLLDVNRVVGCVPGAELGKVVDASTFNGKLKVKVGAVQITYQGTAHIVDTVETADQVIVNVDAKGNEVGGSGAVYAKVAMTVARTASGGSQVSIDADLTVGGKIAQFGRNYIEDISRSMVTEMATCISANLKGGGGGGGGRRGR